MFAYFVILVLLPIMAMAFDLSQMYIYRQHLTNLAQVSALSCFADSRGFSPGKCIDTMSKALLINISIPVRGAKPVGGATNFKNLNDKIYTGIAMVEDNMQTDLFSLSGKRSDKNKRFMLTIGPNKNREIEIRDLDLTTINNLGICGDKKAQNGNRASEHPVGSGKAREMFGPMKINDDNQCSKRVSKLDHAVRLSGNYYPLFGDIFLSNSSQYTCANGRKCINISGDTVSVVSRYVVPSDKKDALRNGGQQRQKS